MNQLRYTYTLEKLAQMFVDYDHIGSQEWDRKYASRVAALASHLDMPPGSTVIDGLREAMAIVLHIKKPLEIDPDNPTSDEED